MNLAFGIVAILVVVGVSASAQHRAVRDDGVTVLLHPNGTWTVAPAPVRAPAPAPPPPAPPAARVFFGNLHSHTSYSDGSEEPSDAYLHARDVAGLDFLAITEHNHAQAPSRIATNHSLYNGPQAASLISTAASFTEPGRFIALYGQEFSSIGSGNHANVLEVNDVIDEAQVPNGAWNNLLDTWLPAHPDSQGQSPIILLNHPSQSSSPNAIEYGRDD